MPYHVDCEFEGCAGCAVVNSDTGEMVDGGCHETREDAEAHRDALYANVEDAMNGNENGRAKRDKPAAGYKTTQQFLKKIDGRTVTGVFSVFGNLDDQYDIVHPGAFSKTFQERGDRVLHLWAHDMYSPPTAVVKNLREIGFDELPEQVKDEFPEATGGAEVTREYLDTDRGNEVLAALKAGSPLQMSFGYKAIKWDYEDDEELGVIRHLRELQLRETSDAPWGANAATMADTDKILYMPADALFKHIEDFLGAIKEGRRNASTDLERINLIHNMAFELGADVCKGIADEDDDEDAQGRAGEAPEGTQTGNGEQDALEGHIESTTPAGDSLEWLRLRAEMEGLME